MTFVKTVGFKTMAESQNLRAGLVEKEELRPLLRIKAGIYRTANRRFTLTKDPTSGCFAPGWGYSSWLVFDERASPDDDPDAALFLDGANQHSTLKGALWSLALEIVRGKFNPSRACPGECDDETFAGPVCKTCLACRLCATTYTFNGDADAQCPGCKLSANSMSPNNAEDSPQHPIYHRCPSCKARSGKPCKTKNGVKLRKLFHAPRQEKAEENW